MPTALQAIAVNSFGPILIPAGNQVDFDIVAFDDLTTTEYKIDLKKVGGGGYAGQNLMVFKKVSDISFQKYTIFSDGLDFTLKPVKSGTDVLMQVNNNNAFDMLLTFVKTIV